MVMGIDSAYLLISAAILIATLLLLYMVTEADLAWERTRCKALEGDVDDLRRRLEGFEQVSVIRDATIAALVRTTVRDEYDRVLPRR
jgi:hypothetical protein